MGGTVQVSLYRHLLLTFSNIFVHFFVELGCLLFNSLEFVKFIHFRIVDFLVIIFIC